MTSRLHLIALATFLLADLPSAAEIPVNGRVTAGGEPVAKARVALVPEVGRHALGELRLAAGRPEPVAETQSDARGLFTLTAPAIGLFRVEVEKPGFAPVEMALRPLVEALDLPDAELEPARAVEVSVIGPDGVALAARVGAAREEPEARSDPYRHLRRRRPGPWIAVSPLGAGESPTLSLPAGSRDDAGTWIVEAYAEGWPPLREKLTGGGKVELEVQAGIERRLEVVDGRGRPLADVLISTENGLLPWALTDARGRATVAVVEGGTGLRLAGPGGRFASHELEPLGAGDGAAERVDRITLEEPLIVRGRVIDRDHRRPIAGALVWAPGSEATSSDAGGAYALAARAREAPFVAAAAVGYATARARIVPGTDGESAERGPTLSLTPAAALGGVVVDREGRPVAEVDVGVTPQGSRRRRGFDFTSSGMSGPRTARSSRQGRFEVRGLALSSGYQLRFTKDGLAAAELEIDDLATCEERSDLRIVMVPGRRGVGWVVDEDDAPIAGAEVRLEKAAAEARGRPRFFGAWGGDDGEPGILTDAEGRFEIPGLVAGRYLLEAEAQGFAAAKVPGLEIADGDGEVDLGTLVLSPGAAIAGRVLDADGLPIAAVEVRVSEQSRMPAAFLRRRLAGQTPAATTGTDGRFVVRDQKNGVRVDLSLSRKGYVDTALVGVEAPTATPLEITLHPTSQVHGRVLDADGRPLASAMVQVRPERQGGSGRGAAFGAWRVDASGDDGTFEVLDVEPGRVTLSARAQGYRGRELSGLEVPAGAPLRDVELRLSPGAEIRGSVSEADGTPAQGVMVTVAEPGGSGGMGAEGTAVSDGDGHYQIAGVGLGPRTVSATDRNTRRVAKSIDVAEGTHVVHLTFEAGVEVGGHVLDAAGAAVEGASVRLDVQRSLGVRRVGLGRLETLSAADGSFVIANVEPGVYAASVSREGFADTALDDPVEVAESPLAGLVIRLESGATLSGRILGLEYDDLVRVQVRAGSGFAEPDFEGRYEIANLAAGEHLVSAEIPGTGRQVRKQVTVPEGLSEVVLDLEFGSGYTLSGVIVHNDRPVAGAMVYLSGLNVAHTGNATVNQDGSFRVEGLPEGRYRLYVSSYDTGLQHSQDVAIEGDDDVRVDILTAEVAGLVRDAFDFEPIEGAMLRAEAIASDASPGTRFTTRSVRSDARGHFSFGEVSEGTWKVVASKSGYGPADELVEVRAGLAIDDLDLAMSAAAGLYFEVRMASGRTPRGVLVALLDGAGNRVAGGSFETTDGGGVRITTAPAGSWEMLLVAEDGATLSLPVTAPGRLGAVVVPQGGSLRITVPELQEGATTASVRLVGPDGRPHRGLSWGATVVAELNMRGGVAQAGNLAAGTWTVTVVAENGRSWTGQATVSPGQTAETALP